MSYGKKITITAVITSIIVGCSIYYMVQMYRWNRLGAFISQFRFHTKGIGHSLSHAIAMYAGDYDGLLPPKTTIENWNATMARYGFQNQTMNPNGGTFTPNDEVAGHRLSDLKPETVIASETNEWPDGGRVYVFAHGKVEFRKLKAAQN